MPRKPKGKRGFHKPAQRADRAQTIENILAGFGLLAGVDHPALAGWPPEERQEIFEAARRVFWQRREAAREPVLLARLRDGGPSTWGSIFAERPDLKDRLTPAQRERWDAWRQTSC